MPLSQESWEEYMGDMCKASGIEKSFNMQESLSCLHGFLVYKMESKGPLEGCRNQGRLPG